MTQLELDLGETRQQAELRSFTIDDLASYFEKFAESAASQARMP